MNILAMYEAQQWHCPARVLTHLDDISLALDAQGIALLHLELPATENTAELLTQSAALITSQGNSAPGFVLPQQRKGEPGYAQAPSQLDADDVQVSNGQWLLLYNGQARLCFAANAGDSALVLACAPGDLVWLPQDMHWAIAPAAGSCCRWLLLTDSETALNVRPAQRSNLSELQLLDI